MTAVAPLCPVATWVTVQNASEQPLTDPSGSVQYAEPPKMLMLSAVGNPPYVVTACADWPQPPMTAQWRIEYA